MTVFSRSIRYIVANTALSPVFTCTRSRDRLIIFNLSPGAVRLIVNDLTPVRVTTWHFLLRATDIRL